MEAKFSDLMGQTLVRVDGQPGGSEVTIVTSHGSVYRMHHDQDCCESVMVEDIIGDIDDIIGSPILLAEERSSDQTPDGVTHTYEPDSQTWTFYELGTIRGRVTLRWFGESNGYYSEDVDFVSAGLYTPNDDETWAVAGDWAEAHGASQEQRYAYYFESGGT